MKCQGAVLANTGGVLVVAIEEDIAVEPDAVVTINTGTEILYPPFAIEDLDRQVYAIEGRLKELTDSIVELKDQVWKIEGSFSNENNQNSSPE